MTERALRFCRFPPESVLLDIGCGNGVTLAHVREVHGLRAVGIDRSTTLLDEARRRHADLSLIFGTAGSLPFLPESFDGVILECTLSLVEDCLTTLREGHRVLRPGGYIIVSDIYLRKERAASGLKSLAKECCLRGARSKDKLFESLDASGFTVDLWEDHSAALKEYAVRLVWSYGSIPSFLGVNDENRAEQEQVRAAIKDSRPGYYLLVAGKEE